MFAEKDRLFDVEQRHQLIFEDASVAVLTADEGFGVQTAIFPHEVNDSAAVFFVVVFSNGACFSWVSNPKLRAFHRIK